MSSDSTYEQIIESIEKLNKEMISKTEHVKSDAKIKKKCDLIKSSISNLSQQIMLHLMDENTNHDTDETQ